MSSFRDYVDWLWQAKGAPYVWWLEGEVSRGDGPPAWSVNAALPDIEDVKKGGFCVAVYNLACRWYGITIPNPYRDEAWDGGVVATWEYWYSSSMWYSTRRASGFVDGDLLISPYQDVSSQGHVAMIAHYNGVPYVLEWITSSGLTWSYTPDESYEWGRYQIVVPMELWAAGKVSPSPGGGEASREALLKAISPYLNNAEAIYDAAQKTGLELPLACALVEQESGGENIFGCDHGNVGDTPPYCHQSVTRERVQALRDGGNYSYGMNGVGLTQLTWWTFVEDAETLGGAHVPQYQCEVGFKLLKQYIESYSYLEALGAYNAGDGNRWVGIDNGYANALASKHASWKSFLASVPNEPPVPVDPDPDIGIDVDKKIKEQIGKWGLYYFASDSDKDWNLTYVPASGKSGPIDTEPQLHKARAKPQEVNFYEQDEKYVVVQPNGTEITYSESEFKEKYEEVK